MKHVSDIHQRLAGPGSAAIQREALLRWLVITSGYLVLAVLLLWPGWALGQGTSLTVDQIAGASGADDESRKLWRMLLGEFADNPFAAIGTPGSLMGSMFLVLNTCFFVVGVTYFSYGILKGVVATAQEGEVLGKKQSVTWFPIRGIIGVAGSMPVFGGFNLMQALLMYIMILGVGIANMVMNKALDMTNNFQGMLQPAAFAPQGVSQGAKDIARQMYLAKLCMIAHNDAAATVNATGVASPVVTQYSTGSATKGVISWGTPSMTDVCGSISVETSQRSSSSMFGFRVASVNYEAYSQVSAAAYQGWLTAISQMDSQITPLAQQWYDARKAALDQQGGNVPPIDISQIDAIATQAIKTATQVGAGQAGSGAGAITSTAMENMKSLGWIGIGAWYSTFAEANAALADAASSVQLGSDGMSSFAGMALNSGAKDVVVAAASKISEGESNRGTGQNATKTLLDSAIQDSGCPVGNSVAGTATGNCSLGQGFVSAFIRGTSIGSGGGGNGGGSLALDSSGLVNPVIALKNVGDYLLTFSTTLLAIEPILSIADKLGLAKVAGAVAGGAAGTAAGPGGSLAGAAVGTIAAGALAFLKVIAFALLLAGAALSVYIPLVPFITWMGAIVAYAGSMFEGLAGMALHAVSHLESEGEGLGQRTSQGYIFHVNAIARPALMVVGFFAASALMIAIGTLQAHLFLPAMANVQGNSITGLMSFLLFVLVFFVINVSLITGAMNLVYVIADQVIGFLGGSINTHLGREVEGKVHAAFMMGARMGPSALGEAKNAVSAVKNQQTKALGGPGGGSGGAAGSAVGQRSGAGR